MLVPGDPATVMLGVDATPQEVEQLREDMGLNKPVHVRFLIWGSNVLRGDLGESFYLGGRSVTGVLLERLPATIQLAIAALFFAVIIGVPMGIFAAIKHNSPADQIVMSVTMIGISIPSFRLGLILILVMSVGLRLLPSCGYAVVNLIVDVLYAFIDPRIKY